MAQNEIAKTSTFNPTSDNCRGYGFKLDGTPVIVEEDGTPKELGIKGEGVAPDNVIANAGVGLDADKPAFTEGVVYVASDTNLIYTGTGSGLFTQTLLSSGQLVTDVSITPNNYYQFNGSTLDILPIGGINRQVLRVSETVNPAIPYRDYKGDGTLGPFDIVLRDVEEGDTAEYSVELEIDTHKIRVTTVSETQLFDNDSTEILVTAISSRMIFKANGLDGYDIIQDGRNMYPEVEITGDRDFTTDGIEHKTYYVNRPAIVGNTNNILLPEPKSFDKNKKIRSYFSLDGIGQVRLTVENGGTINGELSQSITVSGDQFELIEGEGKYLIGQDSRAKPAAFTLALYRTSISSDVANVDTMVNDKEDPDYVNSDLLLTSDPITTTTPNEYATYISKQGLIFGVVPAGTVRFIVTTRLTTALSGNDQPIGAFYRLYKADSAGVRGDLIVESDPFNITLDSFSQFSPTEELPETDLGADGRIILAVYIYRTATGGSDKQLETKIAGTSPARVEIVIPSSQLKHNQISGRDALKCHDALGISYTDESLVETNVRDRLYSHDSQLERYKTVTIVDVDENYASDKTANPSKYNVFPSGYKLVRVVAVLKSGSSASFRWLIGTLGVDYHVVGSETYYMWQVGEDKNSFNTQINSVIKNPVYGLTNTYFANLTGSNIDIDFTSSVPGWTDANFDFHFILEKLF